MPFRTLTVIALLTLCGCKGKKDDSADPTGGVTTGTPGGTVPTGSTTTGTTTGATTDLCGNDQLDGTEECDFGGDNSATGNCLPDCTLSDDLYWTISVANFPAPLIDVEPVNIPNAPLGVGAWKPADSDLNGDGVAKVELHMPMFDARNDPSFFLLQIPEFPLDKVSDDDHIGEIRVSDIAEISFQSSTPGGQEPLYYLYIYTQPDGIDDGAAWYGYRLIAFTNVLTHPAADTWTTYSTNDAQSPLAFVDPTASGAEVHTARQTLTELTATTTLDWSTIDASLNATSIDYGAEVVKYVSITTSSGTMTTDFDGLIDDVQIRLNDGRSFQADLEL